MVISHKHRYLFIEVPGTASWAIRNELLECYGGEPIVHKHAAFSEFARGAKPEQREYFVFATVRNPLDSLVSRYLKYRYPRRELPERELLEELVIDYADLRRQQDIVSNSRSFTDYLRKYHRRPLSEMIDLSRRRLDYVIRFETLQQGFSEVLSLLGIPQVRPLPVINRTRGKEEAFLRFYDDRASRKLARRACAPFMRRWGYEFPADWEAGSSGLLAQLQYHALDWPRFVYMTRLRYSSSVSSRLLRRARAALFR